MYLFIHVKDPMIDFLKKSFPSQLKAEDRLILIQKLPKEKKRPKNKHCREDIYKIIK